MTTEEMTPTEHLSDCANHSAGGKLLFNSYSHFQKPPAAAAAANSTAEKSDNNNIIPDNNNNLNYIPNVPNDRRQSVARWIFKQGSFVVNVGVCLINN